MKQEVEAARKARKRKSLKDTVGKGIVDPSLRVDEIQLLFSISRRSVYRLIEKGEFIAFKVGSTLRITARSVQDFQKRQIDKYSLSGGDWDENEEASP